MTRHCLPLAAALCVSLLTESPLDANLITGSASATGVASDLELIPGVVELGISPTPTVSGTAPAPFTLSDTAASISESAGVSIPPLGTVPIITLSTGAMDVNASSDVDGGPGSRTSSATASVNNVQFEVDAVSSLLLISSLVTLEMTAIESSAMVSGVPGALLAVGSSGLSGNYGAGMDQARLTVLGVEFLLDTSPAANTHLAINGSVVPGLTGSIDVYLNEQFLSGDLMSSADLTVNALRLSFNDVGVPLGSLSTEFLSGDLIFASSSATVSNPEPTSGSLCGIFLAMAAAMRFRRHSRS